MDKNRKKQKKQKQNMLIFDNKQANKAKMDRPKKCSYAHAL